MSAWLSLISLQGIKPLLLTAVIASVVAVQLPNLGSQSSQVQAAPSEQIAPGQLTRRAFSGIVVSKGGSSITVGTKQGNVTVNVNSQTVISAGPVKDLTLADITVGSRVSVKVDKAPSAPPEPPPSSTTTDSTPTPISGSGTSTDATPTPEPPTPTPTPENGTSTAAVIESAPLTIHGLAQATTTTSTPPDPTPVPTATPTSTSTDETPPSTSTDATPTPEPGGGGDATLPPFRTVTALRIHLKQADALVKHQRKIAKKCRGKGKYQVIGEDGDVADLEDETDNGTSSAALIPVDSARIEGMLAAMRGVGGPIGAGGLLFSGVLAQSTSSDNGTSTSSGSDGGACEGTADNLILLLRQKGKSTTTFAIRATLQAQKIEDRLASHIAKLEAKGDTEKIERLTARAQSQKDRIEQRLERTLARADSKHKGDIQGAANKRKGPKSSGDGDGDGPTATPKPKKGGGSSSSSGGSGSGGGSSGGGGDKKPKPTPKPKKN